MVKIGNGERTLETIIGLLGGIVSLIGCSIILFMGSFGLETNSSLGLIGSLMGIFAGFYVNINSFGAALFFFTAGFLVIVSATIFGIPGMLLLFAAGIITLYRN